MSIRPYVVLLLIGAGVLGMPSAQAQGAGQNCSVPATQTDRIQVLPASPTAHDSFRFLLTGARPVSPIDVVGVSSTVSGNEIDVVARMNDLMGFSVAGDYCYQLNAGPLGAGNYVVRYYIESGNGSGGFLPARLVATTPLAIAENSPANVPTTTPLVLGLLALMVALAGSVTLARRTY